MIKIYSTPTCAYCKMAKEFFTANKLQYEELNVLTDLKSREEMFTKSHQMGVPVIDVDGEIIVGFNEEELSKILNIK